MLNSGDSLLLSLFVIIVPALIILAGTFIYSRGLIHRYSKVVSRLYQMSFNGADNERRRISSELHDHLGWHSIHMSKGFESLRSKLDEEEQFELKKLEEQHNRFKTQIHQIVEYMYPRGLDEHDWKGSFHSLAGSLTSNDIRVYLEWDVNRTPNDKSLPHAYWAVKEIITNAVKHAGVNRIQLSVVDEDDVFVVSITYKATKGVLKWLKTKSKSTKGIGRLIIRDRLSVIGAKEHVEVENSAVTHEISLNYEGTHSR